MIYSNIHLVYKNKALELSFCIEIKKKTIRIFQSKVIFFLENMLLLTNRKSL